jgi:fermentation-respiration switch protein FrsA (DUF1100 family)
MDLPRLIVFCLFMYLVFWPLYAAYSYARPPRLRVIFRTPADWGVEFESVQFTSQDGVILDGWYIPSRNGAAIILLHGHSGNRLAVAYHAEVLLRAGYGLLLFDLRAHGSSGGRRFVRGEAAVADVLAAVAFVRHRRDVDNAGLGIMGVSLGGLLAIQAAARTVALRAVVADDPSPAQMADMPPPRHWLDRLLFYPQQAYFMKTASWFGRSAVRTPPLPANREILPRLAPRPILFIATGSQMEQRMTRHFFAAARQPKQLWEIPEASHAAGWHKQPEAYGQQLVSFFNQSLGRRDPAATNGEWDT